jgi:hypothetical protein
MNLFILFSFPAVVLLNDGYLSGGIPARQANAATKMEEPALGCFDKDTRFWGWKVRKYVRRLRDSFFLLASFMCFLFRFSLCLAP